MKGTPRALTDTNARDISAGHMKGVVACYRQPVHMASKTHRAPENLMGQCCFLAPF